MQTFSFDIADVIDLGEGYEGLTLIGPPVNTSGGLAVGDTLLVPTADGAHASCECVEFPLVNLGRDRATWVAVSVEGVSQDDVRLGARASRVSEAGKR